MQNLQEIKLEHIEDVNLSTDIKNNTNIKIINVKQNDINTRYIRCSIQNIGSEVDCKNYITRLNAILPNGTPIIYYGQCYNNDKKCYIKIPSSMLNEIGRITCDISLIKEDFKQSSFTTIYCEANIENYDKFTEYKIYKFKYKNNEWYLDDNVVSNIKEDYGIEVVKLTNNYEAEIIVDNTCCATLTTETFYIIVKASNYNEVAEIGENKPSSTELLKNRINELEKSNKDNKQAINSLNNSNISNVEAINSLNRSNSSNIEAINLLKESVGTLDNTKQDVIQDLDTIREKSNTALQPNSNISQLINDSNYATQNYVNDNIKINSIFINDKQLTTDENKKIDIKLSDVALTGNYNDLENKPNIQDLGGLSIIPNGVNNLLNESNKINSIYLPDYLLGQVFYGGLVSLSVTGISDTLGIIKLTDLAKSKLGVAETEIQINFSQDNTAKNYEGFYFIVEEVNLPTLFNIRNYKVGDWIISNGNKWGKVDNTDNVTMVNNQTGSIQTIKNWQPNTTFYTNDIIEYKKEYYVCTAIMSTTSGENFEIVNDGLVNNFTKITDNTKQDIIQDLDTIREKSNTALQPNSNISQLINDSNYVDNIYVDNLLKSQRIILNNIIADNWVEDVEYQDLFPYSCTIMNNNVRLNDYVTVTFGIKDAISGNYAPICKSSDYCFKIYSKELPENNTLIIPTIIIEKNNETTGIEQKCETIFKVFKSSQEDYITGYVSVYSVDENNERGSLMELISSSSATPDVNYSTCVYQLPKGKYSYDIYKQGYDSITNVKFDIVDEDLLNGKIIEINMTKSIEPYSITINTNLSENTVKIYSQKIEDTSQSTEIDYAFYDIENGMASYSLSKNESGYQYYLKVVNPNEEIIGEKTFIVTDENLGITEEVFYPIPYIENYTFKISPNLQNNNLDIKVWYKNSDATKGSKIFSSSGEVNDNFTTNMFILPIGEYYYNITADGYNMVNGELEVTVNDIDNSTNISKEIIMEEAYSIIVDINPKYTIECYANNSERIDYYKNYKSECIFTISKNDIKDNYYLKVNNEDFLTINKQELIETENLKYYYPESNYYRIQLKNISLLDNVNDSNKSTFLNNIMLNLYYLDDNENPIQNYQIDFMTKDININNKYFYSDYILTEMKYYYELIIWNNGTPDTITGLLELNKNNSINEENNTIYIVEEEI